MDNKVRALIEDESKKGTIEALANCEMLGESYDGNNYRNLVGAHPFLDSVRKFQEVGRILRYGKIWDGNQWIDEVTPDGVVQVRERRFVLDIQDNLADGRRLQSYAEAFGIPYTLKRETKHDLKKLNPKKSSAAEPEVPDNETPDTADKKKRKQPDKLHSLIQWDLLEEKLQGILGEKFEDDLDAMARYMNLAPKQLEDLITGEINLQTYRALRRLATLLYEDRYSLDEVFLKKLKKEKNYDQVVILDLFWQGTLIYLETEDWYFADRDRAIQFTLQSTPGEAQAGEILTFDRNFINRLSKRQVKSPQEIKSYARGLVHYLKSKGHEILAESIIAGMNALRGDKSNWAQGEGASPDDRPDPGVEAQDQDLDPDLANVTTPNVTAYDGSATTLKAQKILFEAIFSKGRLSFQPLTGKGIKAYAFPLKFYSVVRNNLQKPGANLEDMAKKLGISLEDLNQYLAGRLPVKLSEVSRMEKVLSLQPGKLVDLWAKDTVKILSFLFPPTENKKTSSQKLLHLFRLA
ncbi:MAG: hypothetical protein Q8P08_01300, partial [bacterium]|nr:hypothetical protein [bacterium]